MSGPAKKPGKLQSRLAAFEKPKSERTIDAMLSPMHAPKRSLGKKAASDNVLSSPSMVKLEKDKKTILANRTGSVVEFVSKFNLQESLNEEYMQQLVEEKDLRRHRCRTQSKKKPKKKTQNPSKAALSKKKSDTVITSTASVWKNRKASSSITVDPKTYSPPNNMNKSTTENTPESRQLIETAMDQGAMFADPTSNGNNHSNRRQLIDAFEAIHVDAGETIVEEKDDDHFYVIQEGQVDIQVNGVTVRTADKGDTFGELNLLYNRNDEKAVVVASSGTDATKLLRLNQKDYREIMQVQTKQEELEKRELLKKIPFLKKMLFGEEQKNDAIIRKLCSIMQPNQLKAGGEPLAEDDAADTLYVVKDGNIQLTSQSNENFMLAPGDYIGKKPLMGTGKEPTVKSLEAHQKDGTVYSIKRSNVDKVLGKNFFSRHASRMQDRAKLVRI
jgi:CRP-like cAMP-binding protein